MLNLKIDKNTELNLLGFEHTAQLFELIDTNRTYLREWLPWLDATTTIEDSKFFIQNAIEKYNINRAFEAGIWYNGKLAGVIGLHEILWDNQTTAIGYWLGEEFQGFGLMTKACKAVIEHCFKQFKLKTIYINCAVKNTKSRAIPERLGFTQERIKENAEMLYGRLVDHIVYSLDNEIHFTH